jgi:hypothetical protein
MHPTKYRTPSWPSQRELNARANRKFLVTKNTRWHGQKTF